VNVSLDPVILEDNCAAFVGRIEFDSQVLQGNECFNIFYEIKDPPSGNDHLFQVLQ
jgi:peptide methionine sulfoxide reductase MsrA